MDPESEFKSVGQHYKKIDTKMGQFAVFAASSVVRYFLFKRHGYRLFIFIGLILVILTLI